MSDARKPPPLNISAVHERNFVNGPGCRFVVWVQGCHLGCPGCWNKHTWSFAPKTLTTADDLFARIAQAEGLDGVTFTGGEPFLQPRALAFLARRIKAELRLTLQIFTGFELRELRGAAQRELLSLADIVVAGRFNPALPQNGQKVHELTGEKWEFNNTDVEVEIAADGGIMLTGYPPDEFVVDMRGIVR